MEAENDYKVYNVTLYTGKTYSLQLITGRELADLLGNFSEDENENERKNEFVRDWPLLHDGLRHIIRERVTAAVKTIVLPKLETKFANSGNDIRSSDLIQAIIDCFRKKMYSDLYYSSYMAKADVNKYIENFVEVYLNDGLRIVEDIRYSQSFDQVIHQGRITKLPVLLPVGKYSLKIKADGWGNRYRFVHPDQDLIGKEGTLEVFKLLDDANRLFNVRHGETVRHVYVRARNGNEPGPQNSDIDHFIQLGLTVIRETWAAKAVQKEGLVRLEVKLLRSYQIRKTRASRQIKQRLRKVTYNDVYLIQWHIWNAIKEILEQSDHVRAIEKYGPFSVRIKRTNDRLKYRGEYLTRVDQYKNAEEQAKISMAMISVLPKRMLVKIKRRIITYDTVELYLARKELWKSSKIEAIQELSRFLDECVRMKRRLKQGEGSEPEQRSCPANQRNIHDSKVAVGGGPVGIVLRTTSGSSRICCGDEAAGVAGGNPECGDSAEG